MRLLPPRPVKLSTHAVPMVAAAPAATPVQKFLLFMINSDECCRFWRNTSLES
jgi:hypothetical protein